MTTHTAIFDGIPTGLTLTGKVFDTDTPDTEVTGNSLAITEGTNAKGRYAVVNTRATALPAGDYDIRLFVGSVPIAVGTFTFAGTNGEIAVETAVLAELDSAVGTQINNIENASGYLLAVLAGACADPQTASETYAITVFGSTFTVDMAGQTSTGARTAPSLTKT